MNDAIFGPRLADSVCLAVFALEGVLFVLVMFHIAACLTRSVRGLLDMAIKLISG
jgi:hypothetical protein